jgi:hypothetical protein
LCEHFGSSDNNVEPPIWWSRKISWSRLFYRKNNEKIGYKDDISMLAFLVGLCGDFIKIKESLQLIMEL